MFEFDYWPSELDWILYHECGHILMAYVLGSEIEEMGVGVHARAINPELIGYAIHSREKLAPFDQLCVTLAGEAAVADFTRRKPDWQVGSDDYEKAAELVRDYYGCHVRDIVDTLYFERALNTAKEILRKWSLALCLLVLQLRRAQKLEGAQIVRCLERCGVVREKVFSNS
jgi:hypothetical protein